MTTVKEKMPLIIKKSPFDVMATGGKKYEYRINTPYLRSRLYYKDGTSKQYYM